MSLPPPVPRTWSVGDIATGALMNANVRDSVTYFGNLPLAFIIQGTPQSVANATWTPLAFDTNVLDSYSGHSTVTNNSRYTAVEAGTYQVSGILAMTGSVNSHRLAVYKNGSQVPGAYIVPSDAATAISADDAGIPPILVPLAVGDYVQLMAFQDSGGSVSTVSSAGRQCSCSILWVSN